MRFLVILTVLIGNMTKVAFGASVASVPIAPPVYRQQILPAPPHLSDAVPSDLRNAFAPCCDPAHFALNWQMVGLQTALCLAFLTLLHFWSRRDQPLAAVLTTRIRSIIARTPFER